MTDASDRRQRLEVLRDRANALLREDRGAPAPAMDVKQLVHELRVLNTELAMQHDELMASERRGQRQAAAWEQLFRDAPVAILTIDGTRRLEQYNAEAGLMLNLSPRYVTQSIDWLIDTGSHGEWQSVLSLAGSRPLVRELVVRAVGGNRVVVRAMVTRRVPDGEGEPGWLLVFLDVSALAAASVRAKEATSRLERLVNAMGDGVLFARWESGIVEQLNPAMARLLGADVDAAADTFWVVVDSEHVYVTDSLNARVAVLDKTNGQHIRFLANTSRPLEMPIATTPATCRMGTRRVRPARP
jgi:PAS domain-containing protein